MFLKIYALNIYFVPEVTNTDNKINKSCVFFLISFIFATKLQIGNSKTCNLRKIGKKSKVGETGQHRAPSPCSRECYFIFQYRPGKQTLQIDLC